VLRRVGGSFVSLRGGCEAGTLWLPRG
jgi:hypothetical protein